MQETKEVAERTETDAPVEVSPSEPATEKPKTHVRAGFTTNKGQGQSKARRKMARESRRRKMARESRRRNRRP